MLWAGRWMISKLYNLEIMGKYFGLFWKQIFNWKVCKYVFDFVGIVFGTHFVTTMWSPGCI